jgi:hypothetical protein
MVFKLKSRVVASTRLASTLHTSAWLVKQIKTNFVALISLATALSGISYNTWRDHQNEVNDNMRNAAFVVLGDLGELQTIVNYAHFEKSSEHGNPIDGWKHVIMIRDLSRLLKPDAKMAGEALFENWQKNWETLDKNSQAELQMSAQITKTRQAVLSTIDSLN